MVICHPRNCACVLNLIAHSDPFSFLPTLPLLFLSLTDRFALVSLLTSRDVACAMQTLRCGCGLSGLQTNAILPQRLAHVELDLAALDAVAINVAVQSIAQLAALAKLHLRLQAWLPEMCLAPLSAAATLRELIVSGLRHERPTDAQIDQIRALNGLRTVSICELTSVSLSRLLRAPHSLQWTRLDRVCGVNAETAAGSLSAPSSEGPGRPQPRLPSRAVAAPLTGRARLDSVGSDLGGRDCRALCLHAAQEPHPHRAGHFEVHAADPLSATVVARAVAGPLLRARSLHFFSDLPRVMRTLQMLKLACCRHARLFAEEWIHVFALKSLTCLSLGESSSEPLDSLTMRMLTPPSIVLPQLNTFRCAH